MWVGERIAESLVRHGVQYLFGFTGGHVQNVIDAACVRDIRFVQMRHEQGAGYAADGYARLSRAPAAMAVTAGPGFLNAVSALRHAQLARSPIVCFVGGHKRCEDERRTLQEVDTVAVARPIVKWAVRCLDRGSAARLTDEAFHVAASYPPGVVVLELPCDLDEDPDRGDADSRTQTQPPVAGPHPAPDAVARILDAILAAERPLLVAGEGAYWSSPSDTRGTLEAFGLPASFRRLARGTLDERSPLAVPGAGRAKAIRAADLVVAVGMEFSWLEHFGEWPTSAQFVQVAETTSDLAMHIPSRELAVGAAGPFFESLRERASQLDPAAVELGRARKQPWLEELGAWAVERDERVREELDRLIPDDPMHPAVLMAAVAQVAPDATVILDSFITSVFGSNLLVANRPAQILDAGRNAGLGHSIGMAIGARLADPEHPVVAIIGDGGIGIGGSEMEVAARYGVPIVAVLNNNGTVGPGLKAYAYGPSWDLLGERNATGFDTLPGIRYDTAFEQLGCLGAHATNDKELRVELERALAAERPALVNVITDPDVYHPIFDLESSAFGFRHLPPDRVEEPARRAHFS